MKKVEKKSQGWTEVLVVDHFVLEVHPLTIAEAWLSISKNIGRKNYENCPRCDHLYQPGEKVWIAFMWKEQNTHICETCALEIQKNKDKGIPS